MKLAVILRLAFCLFHATLVEMREKKENDNVEKLCPEKFYTSNARRRLVATDDVCYRMVLDTNLDYTSSEDICKKENGRLAVVANAAEQQVIFNHLQDSFVSQNLWIGLRRFKSEVDLYTRPDGYRWSGGFQFNYSRFISTIDQDDGKDCVNLKMDMSGWWDTRTCECEDDCPSFICEYGRVSPGEMITAAREHKDVQEDYEDCPTFDCPNLDCGFRGYKSKPGTYCNLCECGEVPEEEYCP